MVSWNSVDLDLAASEEGIVHEDTLNTDHTNASTVKQGYPVDNPVPSNGLVGYWPLQEDDGTTINDFSGNGNNGNINGGSLEQSGLLSTTSFDSTGGGATIPNSSSLQVTGDLTITWWSYPLDIGGQRQNPIDKAYGGEFAFTIEDSPDTGRLSSYFGSSGGEYSPYASNVWDNVYYENEWTHVAWVRDNSAQDVTLYRNGQDWSSNQYRSDWNSITTSGYDVHIGTGYTGESFRGKLADVRIYNRVLSQSEVQSIYNVPYANSSIITNDKTL